MTAIVCALGATTGVSMVARDAAADPLRLRGDAYASTSSPVGLLVLRGEDRFKPWVDAEAVAWVGVKTSPDFTGDVQTLTVRLRDPKGLGEVRAGRFVFAAGAIRPFHVDGVRALGRTPIGTTFEVFGGAPVAPRFGSRMYDFALGGRLAQGTSWFTVGMSWVGWRKDGKLIDQEIGPDVAIMPTPWLDAAGRVAIELGNIGISEALASVAARAGVFRFEAFATERSPARILPATSLFSVLGDLPSTTAGGSLRVRAAPRLELLGTGAAIHTDGDVGGYGTGRATLALDDDWAGSIGFEVRRQYVATSRWTGVRGLLSLPLGAAFRFATELEVVRPDTPPGTSRIWPWGLVAIAWRAPSGWDFAGAVEALGTRDDRREIHAMLRASFAFERSK